MNPIERLINEALTKVVTSTQCKLCDVKMEMPSIQKAHLSSNRHRQNVTVFQQQVRQTVNCNVVSPVNSTIPPSMGAKAKQFICKVCDRKFAAQLHLDNHNSSETHLRNADCYCSACSLLTTSKENLWEHMKTAAHKQQLKTLGHAPIDGKYTPFSQILPTDLENQMQPDYCYICKIKLPTLQLAVCHYISLAHGKVADILWSKNQKDLANQPKPKPVVKVENQVQPEETAEPCFCYVCNLPFQFSDRNQHLQGFAHSALYKEKQELLSKGISDVYLTSNEMVITCHLCQVNVFSSTRTLCAHTNSAVHIRNYLDWFATAKRVTEESERRKFYCKVCDKGLDGTSCIERHYSGPSHAQKLAMFCEVCDVSNATQDLFNLHQQSALHLENLQRTQKKDLKPDSNAETLKSEPKSPNNNCDNATNKTEAVTKKEDENLKNQVFNELEKLVQKLYYSKEVPYDFGLNYLKKINKEVDEIIIAHNDDKEKRAFSIELDAAASSNINGFDIKNKDDDEGFTEEFAKPLLYPVNFEKPTNLIAVTKTDAEPTDSQIITSENNSETQASKSKKEKKKPAAKKNSIPDLLKDIISQKQNCKENVEDLELLSEIEVLLRQLENIEEPPLLENILKSLQGFNRELDEIDFKTPKDDQKIEAVDIEKNNVDAVENVAETIVQAVEPKSKLVYSKNDLLSLNPRHVNQKENPASIYNYYSAEDFNQFIDFVGFYQQGSLDDLIIDKDIQKNDEINIYNYYSGSDFSEFMNFTEVYLQGSIIKDLNNEP